VTPVGFEPTHLAIVELESTPLDHSGKVSLEPQSDFSIERLMKELMHNDFQRIEGNVYYFIDNAARKQQDPL
jgi:hypothetical protein